MTNESLETKAAAEAVAPESAPETAAPLQPPPPQPNAKPVLLAVLLLNIPTELRRFAQWVLWKLTWKDGAADKGGKWDKVPFQTSGFPAKTNDASTWTSFDAVAKVYENGGFDGVGFVVAKDDGIVAVDLDGVRDPATGELTEDAKDVVARLDTYTEISPSGAGLRLFAKGTLPAAGRSKTQPHGDKYEVYSDLKYLTVTGLRVDGTPDVVNERTQALLEFHTRYIAPKKSNPVPGSNSNPTGQPIVNALTDDELIAKAGKSKSGNVFQALWQGDLTGSKGDASAADLKLCSRLAYWTGKDAARMDALFRKSKLMRSKWDERHGADGQTYGQLTIAKAIAGCNRVFDPTLPQFPDLIAEDLPKLSKETPTYGARQLVTFLYPDWPVAGLDTNLAHARRLRDYLGANLRYSSKLGWLHFNGKSWESDDRQATRTAAIVGGLSRQVRAEAHQLFALSNVLAQAGRMSDAAAMVAVAQSHNAHARVVEKKDFVVDTLHMAAGQDGVRIEIEKFDPKPWIIGFENGVWDHGVWRDHRREDYFLHLCPVTVDFAVATTEWREVLQRISGGNADLERTLQECAGYIFSGASHLRLFLWAYGAKGTGKSTFAELAQTALGKNATTVSPGKFEPNSDRERLGAQLWNRRLAVCAEAGNKRIEPELLKTLSGGDTMPARFLYKEPFEAVPRHCLVLVSNDPPRLDAYDEALKDRVVVLPFLHPLSSGGALSLAGGQRIESVRKDRESALIREFVVWALAGAARVLKSHQVHRAPIVEEAVDQFWKDTDPLTGFWESIPVRELELGIFASELRQRYSFWCEGVGTKPFGPLALKRACESVGLVQVRRTKQNIRTWFLPKTFTAQQIAEIEAARKAGRKVPNYIGGARPQTEKGMDLNLYGTPVVNGDSAATKTPHAVNFPQPDLMMTLDELLDSSSAKKPRSASSPSEAANSDEGSGSAMANAPAVAFAASERQDVPQPTVSHPVVPESITSQLEPSFISEGEDRE